MGVDPNQLLGLITHHEEEGEEKEDKEQFYIKDDQEPEDEGILIHDTLFIYSYLK